jgi:hypothetical protein
MLLADTRLGASLGEDLNVLFVLRIVTLIASIISAAVLLLIGEPPKAD